jgi:uncharacterized DUF497 family protein
MYGGKVVWDVANRRHITDDHPERAITVEEVEQVLDDPDRVDTYDGRHNSHVVIGETLQGRLLVVAYVMSGGGRFPIHARQGGRQEQRVYER